MVKHFQEPGHRWAIHNGEALANLGFPWNLTAWNTSIYRTKSEAMEALQIHRDDLPKGSKVVKVLVRYEVRS